MEREIGISAFIISLAELDAVLYVEPYVACSRSICRPTLLRKSRPSTSVSLIPCAVATTLVPRPAVVDAFSGTAKRMSVTTQMGCP